MKAHKYAGAVQLFYWLRNHVGMSSQAARRETRATYVKNHREQFAERSAAYC